MEREVQRKKHRMHQTIDVEEQANRRKTSMPQIQEAENEDKDYQTDLRPLNQKNKQVLPGIGDKPKNLENYDINGAVRTNNSEPGNRQGDDAPNVNRQFYGGGQTPDQDAGKVSEDA